VEEKEDLKKIIGQT